MGANLNTLGAAVGLSAATAGGCSRELARECYDNTSKVDARTVALDFQEEHARYNTTEDLTLTMNREPVVDFTESDGTSVMGQVKFVLHASSDFQDGEILSDERRDHAVQSNLVGIGSDEMDFRDADTRDIRNVFMNDCDGDEGQNGICAWVPFEKGKCDDWEDVCLSVLFCADEIVEINKRVGACLDLDGYYNGDTGCDR